MQPEENIHAGCVVLGDRGVLITGESGAGKTALALALIEKSRASGRYARLVADDRVIVRACSGRLIARVPAAIAGLVEVYGVGPQRIEHEKEAVIDLVVDLVPLDRAARFADEQTRIVAGCALPALVLAERDPAGAALAISAWFGQRPFL